MDYTAGIMDFTEHHANWLKARDYGDATRMALARAILEEVRAGQPVRVAARRHPKPEGGLLGKDYLVQAYRALVERGEWAPDPALLRCIRMKPVRTLSGVTTVTALTKPYPCPGKCIFCPTDVRMPKSYLHDEPGAMRAEQHAFDPYEQTRSRIQSLENVGHPTGKIELLILGGTWSSYRRDYQAWFVQRCLDARNRRPSASLAEAQAWNRTALHRNVGLCIETRPDHVDPAEIAWLRSLGVTRVQIGVQSLDDRILALNQRGHDAACTRAALRLLRAAGFKLLTHWMPNLLGATPPDDAEDGLRLWSDPDIRPDELKIYPCSLLANAELVEHWQRGEYQPYTHQQLVELIAGLKPHVQPYTRINRVVRDIPAGNVVAGNRRSNLRQEVQRELAHRPRAGRCCRCCRTWPARRWCARCTSTVSLCN
ncbi:MAG: radical SAM protein [Chloroflexi bacterium]|nr:radical SAM protein [Chloroflexota bacterium]